jgi:cohesin domain-containing protein
MKQAISLAIVPLFWFSSTAWAQHGMVHGGGAPAPLTLELASATAGSGEEIDLPITAKGAAGLGPMQMALVYDPAVLQPVTVERGPILSGNTLLEFFADPSGRLAIAWATQDAITSDGILVKVRFKVIGNEGQKSSLILDSVRAWDAKSHLDALVTPKAGEFAVQGKGFPWLWIAAALAILVLLLVIVILARRRAKGREQKG